MFHTDFRFDAPIGDDLLAELGVRSALVSEIADDERAIRCPSGGAVYPEHGFASLDPEPPLDRDPHAAGPDRFSDPAPARHPAGRSRRRA